MREMRADYGMAEASRHRTNVPGGTSVGRSADWHFRNELDYIRCIEYARQYDRDHPVVSAALDRAVDNILQGGINLDPKTSDREADDLIAAMWDEWSSTPAMCDVSGRSTLNELTRGALRSVFVDGDQLAAMTVTGAIQTIEGHRVQTPNQGAPGTTCSLGVELDDYRTPVGYWVGQDEIDPSSSGSVRTVMQYVPAYDDNGNQQIFHVAARKRPSQTRGVSAFAPCYQAIEMYDDISFAKMVQQQVVSCITFFRKREASFTGGLPAAMGEQTVDTEFERTLEELAPGAMLTGQPGESIEGFSPNTPNSEFFEHVNLILQTITINIGLPLMLVLLKPDGTYSAYRGALDQARLGWACRQRMIIDQFLRPVYRWMLDYWADTDERFAAIRDRLGKAYYRHKFNPPTWPYIDPLVDVQADERQISSGLNSPRRVHAARGRDYFEVVDEIIADNFYAIRKAKRAASKLNEMFPNDPPLSWREVMPMPSPAGQSVSITPEKEPTEPPPPPEN